MSQTFFSILTAVGEAKHANAALMGTKVEYATMAVGDGNGVVPIPSRNQTSLVNQMRREAINTAFIDPDNSSQIVIEQIIPENEGGWWIREVAIYDTAGDMIAVAGVPPTYKPQLQEGSGRLQVVRVVLLLADTSVVSLKIDPAVVLATRSYVDSVFNTPSGVVPGTYGGDTKAAIFTVDTRGRLTSAGEIVVPSVWDAIPTEHIGDIIFVKGLGEMWWVDNEFLTGYRTKECGFPLQNIDRVNRSFTIALDGGFFDKTLPKFKGLYSFIREQDLLVAESAWIDGEFFFCEAGDNMVKLPNQDDMFWRNKGTDKDTANARGLGSKQLDALQNIVGSTVSRPAPVSATSGIVVVADGAFVNQRQSSVQQNAFATSVGPGGFNGDVLTFDASRVARTSAETRTANSATGGFIRL